MGDRAPDLCGLGGDIDTRRERRKARAPGQIVILNGAPRSGKSSIVEVIQDTFDGGLPVLFVGVRCPIETLMERRRTTGWATGTPLPVGLWQREVHTPGIYDLEVDTSVLGPEACAAMIRRHLDHGQPPSAFRRRAAMAATRGREA